jgi:hypothetical protein
MPTRFPYSYFLARAKKALPGWKFPDTDPGTGKWKVVNFKLSTAGTGYWSRSIKTVTCTKIDAHSMASDGDREFGELRVYFDTKTWNIRKDGFIYTDPQFLAELRAALNDMGFEPEAVDDVEYSEQGMQGDDYVSLDVCEVFLPAYRRMTATVTA